MEKGKKTGKIFWILLTLAAFVFLACHFFNNRWQLNPYDSLFRNWQLDSEQLVLDKVVDARSSGIGNYNGMMLEYQQQIGFAGMLFSAVDKLVNRHAGLLDPIPKDVMCGVNAVLFTAVFFVILYWICREFGRFTSVVVYVTALFTHWLGFTAKNLYWMTWTMLLPMAAVLLLLLWEERRGNPGKEKNGWLFALSLGTIFLRSACGYEFISCAMVALELPLIYYALRKGWGLHLYLKRAVIAGLGALAGFGGALFVNLAQMAGLKGWSAAVEYLIFVSARRTGYATLENFDADVLASFQVPLPEVLKRYYQGTDIRMFGSWNLDVLLPLFLVFALAAAGLWIFRKRKRGFSGEMQEQQGRKALALTIMMLVSLAGPLSWLVLAKGHAVHHEHIDYLIFSLPFTLLGFASVAQDIRCWAGLIREKYGKRGRRE